MPEEGQREERVAQGLHRQLQEHVPPAGKTSTMSFVVMGDSQLIIMNLEIYVAKIKIPFLIQS